MVPYNSENIFAKILCGEANCIAVYEDEFTLAFMDIMPQTDGHTLVIPKEPAETLFELSEEGLSACTRTLKTVATAVQSAFECPGVMIAQLNGSVAGQTVPHFHFHIIPRYADGSAVRAHGHKMEDTEKLQGFAERIRACL